MIERLKAAYADNDRFRLAALVGLLLCAGIFAALSGGFPPWAWRFLFFTVLPTLPHLLAQQGGAVLLPLLGLILLSLSLFIVWVVLVALIIKIALRFWQDQRARQHFNQDLQEAEELAERNVASAELERWFEGENASPRAPRTPAPMGRPEPATSALHSSHSSATEAMQTNMSQRREYATSGLAARVSGGGMIFPETPTPVANPGFRAPSASAAPLPTSLLRERSAPWLQPETGRYSQQNSGEENEDWLNDQPKQTQHLRQPSSAGSTSHLTGSVHSPFSPPLSLPTNPARKQLHIVPPPPVEEPATDGEQSLDQAFSALLARERVRPVDQPAPTRFPERPEWADVEDAPDIAPPTAFLQALDTRAGQAYPSMIQPPDLAHDVDPSTDASDRMNDRHGNNIYDTVPIDEGKLGRAPGESEGVPRLVVGIGLDPGIKRRGAPNEDSIFAIQGMRITDGGSLPAGLFVVADGMGGHVNGREASRVAIHTVSDVIVPALLRDVSGRDADEEETIFQDMLKDGVHRANLAIYRRNRESPEMMGTTLTAALIANSTAYIGNVGDSRTYLYRPSEGLRQVTHDHSEVARLVENGTIAPQEIYTHPQRNIINRCLGRHSTVDMDMFIEPLQPGDLLLLCSDGLWEMVQDPQLEKLIEASAHNPTQLSAILVQAALNHGGADNISVVVVGFL